MKSSSRFLVWGSIAGLQNSNLLPHEKNLVEAQRPCSIQLLWTMKQHKCSVLQLKIHHQYYKKKAFLMIKVFAKHLLISKVSKDFGKEIFYLKVMHKFFNHCTFNCNQIFSGNDLGQATSFGTFHTMCTPPPHTSKSPRKAIYRTP